jgi:PPK2 family polyphosphate:nucleotide phosphotransferase
MAHKLDHKPFLVKPGKQMTLADHDAAYTAGFSGKKAGKLALLEDVTSLAEAQALLWANARHSVLVILQALDAAGKDGAIKYVMSGVNPQGVDVYSFKAPSEEERLRHFMWRPIQKLPARGRIAVFNRSYYEEVLVVRVHPSFLDQQVIPTRLAGKPLDELWQARFEDINRTEAIWSGNDISIIKLFLNVSKDEQRRRFLERLENPEKNWKFSAADLRERGHWDEYQRAYEAMLAATSTRQAPWYVIPADHKWFARAAIADIIVRRIAELKLEPPKLTRQQKVDLAKARAELELE